MTKMPGPDVPPDKSRQGQQQTRVETDDPHEEAVEPAPLPDLTHCVTLRLNVAVIDRHEQAKLDPEDGPAHKDEPGREHGQVPHQFVSSALGQVTDGERNYR